MPRSRGTQGDRSVTLKNTLSWLGDLAMVAFLRSNRLSVVHYVGWPQGDMGSALKFAWGLWGSGATDKAHRHVARLAEGTLHARL